MLNTVLLQYALEVEKTGSITQAASNLYMEQPNLSKAIKSLEEMMGAPIFARSPKGVVPTAKGKVFLDHARKVLAQIEEMESVYKKPQDGKLEFRLSIPRATYLNEAFSRLVKELDRKQGMRLWLHETNSMETMDEVADGTCQIGIVRYPIRLEKYYMRFIQEKELCGKVIWEYHPVLLMSDQNPLSKRAVITYSDLSGYTEILHGDIRLPEGAETEGRHQESERRIYVFERGSQFNLLQMNPDTYMWVSPLPKRYLSQNTLVQKPCNDMQDRYRDVYIYRQGYTLNEQDKRFLHTVHEVKKEIETENP